jgi:hypothetical protein
MTQTLANNAPHVIEEVLNNERQQALDEQCNKVTSLLGSAFFNKVDAVRELEAIRWTGEWTYDNFWNEIEGIEGYTAAQLAKIPRDWVTYVDLVRGFRIEGEPIAARTYDDLRTAGALIDAINFRNSQCEGPALPLPVNPSQTQPFASLLARGDRGRDLSGFAPAFRSQIENALRAGGNYNSNPYSPAVEQVDAVTAWADCWDALPSDRQYDNLNRPVPPSQKWSRQVLAASQTEALGKGETVKLPSRPTVDATVRKAVAEKTEKESAEFKKMMADIRERREDIGARNEQERIAAEIRRKEAAEQDEIKGYVREYSFAINEVLQSSQKLLTFLKKLSNIKGTEYLAEMRAFDLGIVSCRDDVQRFQLMQERLGEIFKLASSSNPPTGIDMSTFTVDADAQEDLF